MTTTPNQPDRERAIAMIDGHPEDGGGIQPWVTYADHSYPAYSRRQMIDFALAFRDADRAGEDTQAAFMNDIDWLRMDDHQRAIVARLALLLTKVRPATPLLDDETVERCAEKGEANGD